MDDAGVLDPAQRLQAFAQDWLQRPVVPAAGLLDTLHVGADDLPFAEAGDGSALQLLHVDLNQGLWISKTRLPKGYRVATHYHTGPVFAVTLAGRWYYEETPDAVNRPGSYLFEPAGSRHTLVTPDDLEGDMIAWFAIFGANINVDASGAILSVIDARAALELYRGYCTALGLDFSRLIVVGA